MGINATDPIGLAGNRTGRMLFKPFSFTKWLVMGFAAFLAYLAEGGGGNLNQFRGWGGGGGGGGGGGTGGGTSGGGAGSGSGTDGDYDVESDPGVEADSGVADVPGVPDEVKQFLLTYGVWIVLGFIVLMIIWLALLWVRARGKFIFLDCVVRDHAAIVEPWKRLAPQANSFFRFDLVLLFAFLGGLLVIGVLGYVIALPDIRAQTFGSAGITAAVVGGVLLLVWWIAYALVAAMTEDFVIPLMYLRAQGIGAGWREFRRNILASHAGAITLFYLVKFCLGIGIAIILTIGTCITCCIAGLPYVSSVFFLPIFVFMRSYSLYFLAQFGPEYSMMVEVAPRPLVYGFEVGMPPPPAPGAPTWPPLYGQPQPPPMPPPIPPQGDQPQ